MAAESLSAVVAAEKHYRKTVRTCRLCKTEKAITEFRIRSNRPGQLQSECRQCEAILRKARYRSPAGQLHAISRRGLRHRTEYLRYFHGMSLVAYERLLANQGHRCAICRTTQPSKIGTRKYFYIDHCHQTGAVRGLLCVKCNTGLGALGDTLEAIQRVMEYLARPERGVDNAS